MRRIYSALNAKLVFVLLVEENASKSTTHCPTIVVSHLDFHFSNK